MMAGRIWLLPSAFSLLCVFQFHTRVREIGHLAPGSAAQENGTRGVLRTDDSQELLLLCEAFDEAREVAVAE
jgi:hypothetical protein